MIIKLTIHQFDYLNNNFSEGHQLLKQKIKQFRRENEIVIIEIDEDIADEIRDWAGDKLQKVGLT
jgi:hypothetical protein